MINPKQTLTDGREASTKALSAPAQEVAPRYDSVQTVQFKTKPRVSNCHSVCLLSFCTFQPLCSETQPPTPASTASSSVPHMSDSELRLKTTRSSLVCLVTMLSALKMTEHRGVRGERAVRTMKTDTWSITSAC